jgi:hypothetical protein
MPLRRLIVISSLALAIAAVSPTAALAKAHDRSLKGILTNTTTVSLVTGAATSISIGHVSHLGRVTGSDELTFTLTGVNGFSFTGPGILVAANGDELFTSTMGSGTFGPPIGTTGVTTITGGTGRFAGASGMYSSTSSPVVVSLTATSETTHATGTLNGRISY